MTDALLALAIAAVALLAFTGGYLIGHWRADHDRQVDPSQEPHTRHPLQ